MKKAALLFVVLLIGSTLWTQQRYALVIGNNNYTSVRRLDNPVNDATDIAAKLRTLGYQVDLQTNVTNVAMARVITDFINRLSQNRDNEGFFWFAGHAVQINGENYLLPIDVISTNEVEAVHSSYSVRRLVDSLNRIARNKVNVVVLDACRNNPFVNMSGSFRSVSRGLSVIQNLPPDLLIIYSTAPGDEAQDGPGQRNSPFTQAFLQSMDSNEDIQIVFRAIARETMRLTNNNQRPFNDGSIISLDFYSLNPRGRPPTPVQPPVEYIVEVPRDEADREDEAAYIAEVLRNEANKDLAEYITEVTRSEIYFDERTQLEYEVVNGRSITITKYTGNATTLNIPAQIQGLPVTAIDYGAFNYRSSLTNITIPSSVTSTAGGAFYDCSSLTNITVDSRNPAYASIDGVLFDKNIRTLISYPAGKTTRTYTIPSSVTSIGDVAFYYCNSLTNITIPSSVTSIGYFAFTHCSSLTSITIPSSVTSIGHAAFYVCSSLTSVTLSRRTQVGDFAFHATTRITYRD